MFKYSKFVIFTCLLGACCAIAEPVGEGSKPGESTDGMVMQRARAGMMTERGERIAYTTQVAKARNW